MVTRHRRSRPLLTYAGAVCVAFLGTWGVTASEARRPSPTISASDVRRFAPPVPAARSVAPPAPLITPAEPAPSRDSLAALLVSSSPPTRRAPRGQTALLRDVISVTEQMSSWTERAGVLEEIAQLAVLDSSIVSATARAASTIPMPGARGRVLRTLIHRHSHAIGASRGAVLSSIGSMNSTSEKAAALELFVTRPRLSQPALADALAAAARLPSNGDRSSVLIAAARANRIEGRARTIYVQAAAGLSSGRHRSRVLSAIGARNRSNDDHTGG